MRTVAVIQARCGSARLPNKVCMPLAGLTVVEHVMRAARAATLLDDVVLATTTLPADDALLPLAQAQGVRVVRGSPEDVLSRFCAALEGDAAQAVVRLTADDPLLDPGVIDTVVGHFLRGGSDYTSNIIDRSWPRGLDTEVMSRDALARAHREGLRPDDREHVTLFIRTHPHLFRLRNVAALPQETWPELRLCIDTAEDAALLTAVFAALHRPGTFLRVGTVIDWLRQHPEVAQLNAHVQQRPTLGRVF